MWSRCDALCTLRPSQQPGKSNVRVTALPAGQRGYFAVKRPSNPAQPHFALAFRPPLVAADGLPVIVRRNRGSGTTPLVGLPVKVTVTDSGGSTSPVLPCTP